MNTRIKKVHARQIMDCKFCPAVEVDVELECGAMGRFSSPMAENRTVNEAFIMRDSGTKRFMGKSVFGAVKNINEIIASAIVGMDAVDIEAVDTRLIELDGTEDKSRFGANTLYSVSMACVRAAAEAMGKSLYEHIAGRKIKTVPMPVANSIIGGRYDDKTISAREFSFCPYKAKSMTETMEIIVAVHKEIGNVFSREFGGVPAPIGNGHGWMPPTDDILAVMGLLEEAVMRCGHGDKVAYALDMAAGDMYDENTGTYLLCGRSVSADEQVQYIKKLTERFNILFVEDILRENDWTGFAKAEETLGRTTLVGDMLTATNVKFIERANKENAVRGFVMRPDQIGTVTEAVKARKLAKEHGFITIASHRDGGPIWDSAIDLGVGLEAEAALSCAPRGGENVYAMNCVYRAADENPEASFADLSPYIKF